MGSNANNCLKEALELAERLLKLADAGDAAREDVGCGILYGIMRDAGFRLKSLAEAERRAHIDKKKWEE